MPAGDVIDEIRQALRHRRFGMPFEQGVQLARGTSGVECAPDRRLADPVNHRRARRFDVRHRRQLLGEIALQRSGHDDRQVGLEQEVVDGFGQHPVHRVDGVSAAGQKFARRAGDRAAAHDAKCMRFGQQVADGLRLQSDRPPGATPDHRPRRLRGVDACADG